MNNQGMIAYLPTETSWCKQDLPHMTLVFIGSTEGRAENDFNRLSKDAIQCARITGSFSLPVTGIEEFGDDDDAVDVLTLYPTPQLLVARNIVESWNGSQYKDYKPHATIGPAGSAAEIQYNHDNNSAAEVSRYEDRRRAFPLSLRFSKIGAFWDNKKLIFNLDEFY